MSQTYTVRNQECVPVDGVAVRVVMPGPQWCAPKEKHDLALKQLVALTDAINASPLRPRVKRSLHRLLRGKKVDADVQDALFASELVYRRNGAVLLSPYKIKQIHKSHPLCRGGVKHYLRRAEAAR